MIRKATCDDIPAILALGKELHAKGWRARDRHERVPSILAQAVFTSADWCWSR